MKHFLESFCLTINCAVIFIMVTELIIFTMLLSIIFPPNLPSQLKLASK